MDDVVLHPTERARRVREAALDAGRRLGWPVPEGLLNRIEAATAGLRLGQADAERVAAGVVERAKQDELRGTGPTSWEASNRQASHGFRIIFGAVVHDIAGLLPALASREEDASAGDTGARFDAIYTGTDWSSEAGQRYMRDYARRCGMGWAGEHPDLLRMGPGAIQALRDANFRRESFRHLRDAGFDRREAARTAVGISRYAVQHGLDANRIAEETAGAVNSFGADSPEERRRWIERFERFYQNPDDEAARANMSRALTEMETRGTPEQRERVQRLRPLMRIDREARTELNAATLTADTTAASDRAVQEARERAAREARERAAREAAAREAERAKAEERARQEAAERARLAALLGEEPPTKGPATVVQEGPPTKTPAVQEGPASKEAPPPVRLAAAPGP